MHKGRPPDRWLEDGGWAWCPKHRALSVRGCRRCRSEPRAAAAADGRAGRDLGKGSPAAAACGVSNALGAGGLPSLATVLRAERAVELVRDAIARCSSERPRLSLPPGAVSRSIAAEVVRTTVMLATEGVEAAQLLFPWLPRVLLQRGRAVRDCLGDLVQGRAPPPRAGRDRCPEEVFCQRMRDAVADRNVDTCLRMLEAGPVAPFRATTEEARAVIAEKFPEKPAYPRGSRGEDELVARLRRQCGGAMPKVTGAELLRWARAKRRRAADVGGWSPRLLVDLASVDGALMVELAELASRDPAGWQSREGAVAAWRTMRAGFVPQEGKSPRPIAVPPLLRRAWGGILVRRCTPAVRSYCAERGQLGVATAAGQMAYGVAARVLVQMGATMVVRDKSNSFHELERGATLGAVADAVRAMPPEVRENEGRALVELVARTYARVSGNHVAAQMPYARYVFGRPDVADRENPALCQGSPESSLMEALTYAATDQPRGEGMLSLEFHDDGFVAAMPGAAPGALRTKEPTDGSRLARSKWKAVGPGAADAVRRGEAATEVTAVTVNGTPVGDVMEGLRTWRGRYRKRLDGMRRLAELDAGLAAQAAMALGGPAALGYHLLRTVPPTEAVVAWWRGVDAEWVDLWQDILGVVGGSRRTWRAVVEARVFLQGKGAGLGLRAAAEHAAVVYLKGLAQTIPELAKLLGRAGLSCTADVWGALGVPVGRARPSWEQLGKEVDRRLVQEEAKASRTQAGYAAVLRAARPAGVGMTVGEEEVNLYQTWMKTRPPMDGRWDRGIPNSVLVVRRAFGLPVYGVEIGNAMPPACLHAKCGVAARSEEGEHFESTAPTKSFDKYGEHAMTCRRTAAAIRRHNALVASVGRIAGLAGCRPYGENTAALDRGYKRPGDVYLARWPGRAAGMAVDVTCVSRWTGTHDAAVQAKHAKYRAYFDEYREMGLTVFGMDLTGSLHPEAVAFMKSLISKMAQNPANTLRLDEASQWAWGDLAWTFANEIARQIRSSADPRVRVRC